MNNDKQKSSHILNTSSNLLGICFIVLTSLHAFELKKKTIIDEITTVAVIIFMCSSILSFLSIRSKTFKGDKFEQFADVCFLCGLGLLFITTLLLALRIIE